MLDIDVVDGIGQDLVTIQDRGFFPHALRVANLGDLVSQLVARIGFSHDLRRLRVIGHGHSAIPTTWAESSTPPRPFRWTG